MNEPADQKPRHEYDSRAGKGLALAGCAVVWLFLGWLVLAASAMFLVNPKIDGNAWLLFIIFVWIGSFLLFAGRMLRK